MPDQEEREWRQMLNQFSREQGVVRDVDDAHTEVMEAAFAADRVLMVVPAPKSFIEWQNSQAHCSTSAAENDRGSDDGPLPLLPPEDEATLRRRLETVLRSGCLGPPAMPKPDEEEVQSDLEEFFGNLFSSQHGGSSQSQSNPNSGSESVEGASASASGAGLRPQSERTGHK